MPLKMTAFAVAFLLLPELGLYAQREPVLKQIDLPHPYYYREMYLPQLTTGPSSLTWSPDSKSVIFSMQGALWRQRVASHQAEQLTAGPGYDYQPDWSPDGRWIVYASYDKDAIELRILDLQTGSTQQLTTGSAVNVEPRWSPDGKRILFVSTSYHDRFHIFVARVEDGKLKSTDRLTGETHSELPRYYYSEFDTEISPCWSPDGNEIFFISNRGHIYGSGGLWRMKAEAGADPREIYFEETTWKGRPDWSPDGKHVVYSSYLGRQWNQLWAIPAAGGHPLQLSYGEFDATAPRWSHDGRNIGFISNRDGNTSLWIQDAQTGEQLKIAATNLRYLHPMGKLKITVLDTAGHPTPARVSVTGADGRAYAPEGSWIRADDSFDRSERRFEAHYFLSSGRAEVVVPPGTVEIDVMKGFEYKWERLRVQVEAQKTAEALVRLHQFAWPADGPAQWVSADLHVHMDYGGNYRNTPEKLVQQAQAEDLGIVFNLIVNKEERVPDIAYFSTQLDPASTPMTLLSHGQEFHTSFWGHLGLLHPGRNFLIPGYAGYPGTAAASLYPTNAAVADMGHAEGALVGYVHPFEAIPDPAHDKNLTSELPVDVALGKVDYIEILGFSDHKSTAAVWYRLLNCGFHLPAGAGTDAMMNFASLRGPLGLNRVYAALSRRPIQLSPWLESLKNGQTFATNGPLLRFRLANREIGGEVNLPAGSNRLDFSVSLRSIVPIDHLEIVCNGRVAQELALEGDRTSADVHGKVTLERSGWCLLRAWSEKAEYPILDLYPYATTSPIYITVGGEATTSADDARYFLTWIDRLNQAAITNQDWNTGAEKEKVSTLFSEAAKVFQIEIPAVDLK
ncbi:MAG: CehA/McbA family metallohydrolase [Candidatus Acidiferrales bacterium]